MSMMSILTAFKAKDGLSPMFSKATKKSNAFTRSITGANMKVNRAFSGMTRGALGLTAAIGGVGFAINKFLIGPAAEIEDAEAAFTPLMGGAKNAIKLIEALNKTAASTPFQFGTIANVTKQLLPVMNQDIERTVKTLRMLGDTAGGNAQKLDSITRGFTKAMLKGKVDMESLNMIGEAGVPIFTELANSMGTEVNAAFFKMISAGKVTTKDLTKAFETMTSKGGIFFEGMTIASKTWSGKMSTLADNIKLTQAAIGKGLIKVLKPYVDNMIIAAGIAKEWVEANQDIIKLKIEVFFKKVEGFFKFIFKHRKTFIFLAKTIFVFVAAIKVMNGVLAIYNTITGITALVTKLAAKNQWKFNAAMLANPIGLTVLAVTALVAGFFMLAKRVGGVGNAFKVIFSFIKAGVFSIGQLIANYLLLPLEGLLFMLTKIPGVGKKVAGAYESVKGLRENINAGAASARAEAGQRAGDVVAGKGSLSKLDINLKSADGSSAEVSSDKTAPGININNMTLGFAQ